MFWNKSDKKYLNKIYAKVMARKTPYYHRNLLVNDKITHFKIIKIKKGDSILQTVGGYTILPDKVCYLVEHAHNFNTVFFHSKIDVVLLNIYWKAIGTYSNVLQDKVIKATKDTNMVLIMPVGSIAYLNIKEKDTVRA